MTRRGAGACVSRRKRTRTPRATVRTPRRRDGAETETEAVPGADSLPGGRWALDEGTATWVLAGVTVVWGTQHAVMKAAVADAAPGALTAARFAVAAALLSPWLRGATRAELRGGLELGLWSFAGFALQTAGLESTTAARSCFLLYLNVKMVPFLGLLAGRAPPARAWAAAALALCGTYALAGDSAARWAPGDTLSVLAAVASACFIVRLSAVGTAARAAPLSAATVAVTAALGVLWSAANHEGLPPADTWGAALYLGAVPTALATYLQSAAQRTVPPERAAVIYAMDPVYGALFANVLLGETFGTRGVVGAALIVLAALVSNVAAAREQNKDDDRWRLTMAIDTKEGSHLGSHPRGGVLMSNQRFSPKREDAVLCYGLGESIRLSSLPSLHFKS